MKSCICSRLVALMCVTWLVVCTQCDASDDLRKLVRSYGFPEPTVRDRVVTFKSKYTTMVFEEGSRRLRFNDVLIWMHEPLIRIKRKWLVSDEDADSIVKGLLGQDRVLRSKDSKIVVLDAGHGGDDAGAVGSLNVQEKLVALDITLRVEAKLQASKVAVSLTRKIDTYLSLSERWEKANNLGADVFVSIHLNSARNTNAAGVETFVATIPNCMCASCDSDYADSKRTKRNDAANTVLAYYLQKGLLSCTAASDRGVKRARFQVVKNVNCPAALVECGFLSNREEEKRFTDAQYINSVAEGIARGILTYLSRVRNVHGALDR